MMGTKMRTFVPLVELSLEELVPEDNLYRHLEERLDLSFVEGRVRRLAMTMPLPDEPRGGPAVKGSVKAVQELYDFGAPVGVEAPPAGQTEDVTDEVLKQTSLRKAA